MDLGGRSQHGARDLWAIRHTTYGEADLQVLKDVHWKALTVLDKLHQRDRRAREKAIVEYAREASKGAAGSLHRLTKPRPRDAAHGEATNPQDAAELAAKSWSRFGVCTSKSCKQQTPNGEDVSVLLQLEVDGPSGFDAVVGSFRPKRALVSTRFIPQCGRASQKRVNKCTLTC